MSNLDVFTIARDLLVEYIDIDFTLWLTWLLMPLIATFVLPLVLFSIFYFMSIICYVYKYRELLLSGVRELSWKERARRSIAMLWDAHGWLWHSYEVEGLDNIPEGGGVIVYYHGTLPIDVYYFTAKVYLVKNRNVHAVADRFLWKLPGFGIVAEGMNHNPGNCWQLLSDCRKRCTFDSISRGVYEALFGDHTYPIMWKSRTGFAKVAINSNVPIVPMFTENVREAFRTLKPFGKFWLKLYTWTRLPLVPIYGGFPVKLVTHLGKPIYPKTSSPLQLQKECADAINALIEKHQRLPGSIIMAVADRFFRKPKSD